MYPNLMLTSRPIRPQARVRTTDRAAIVLLGMLLFVSIGTLAAVQKLPFG